MMTLGLSMVRIGNTCHSAFPDGKGTPAPVARNRGQATVASYQSMTGGLAML